MTRRMLHVLETCGAGGIETTFLNVLLAWRRDASWASHDVVASAGGVLAARFASVADGLIVAAEPALMRDLLRRDYDVVHFLFERPATQWIPYVVGHTSSAVVYGKGYDMAGTFRLNDGLRWQPDESVMWGCNGVTFTTAALAAGYVAPDGQRAVLGKAADVTRFLDIAPATTDGNRRIVCVANLHALKRLGDLLDAVAQLVPALPDVVVRFVGADASGEGAHLRARANRLGIAAHCEWVGRCDDVGPHLAAARVFALPSGREGVPTAMLEAMAAARPVVVSDVGHVRTVVTDGVEGYLVPVGDIAALTHRLRRLLADPHLAAEMGEAGRQRARQHDVVVVAARLRDALLRAATAGRTHGAAA